MAEYLCSITPHCKGSEFDQSFGGRLILATFNLGFFSWSILADEDYQYDYGYDDGDYTNDDQKDEVIEEHPTFVTLGSTFTFDRGNTIRLPCYVDKLPRKSLDNYEY